VLRILVLGGGGMGRKQIDALLSTSRCQVSCVEPDPRGRRRIQTDHPQVSYFSDLAAVRPEGLDGVVIATPTQHHIDHAMWCIDNGLPVLIEKPLAVTERGLAEFVAAVRRSKVPAGVAFPRRSLPAVRELKRQTDSGLIGKIRMVTTDFSQDFRKYRPDYRETYYARLESGGGLITDALSHHVNLATAFVGEVESVTALSGQYEIDGCEGEDAAVLALSFRGGCLGCVRGNQFQKPNVDAIELVGTEGNLRYERVSGVMRFSDSDSGEWETKILDGDYRVALQEQAEEFLDAIDGMDSMRTGVREAWHVLRVALAARQSAKERRTVRIEEILT